MWMECDVSFKMKVLVLSKHTILLLLLLLLLKLSPVGFKDRMGGVVVQVEEAW